MAGTWGRTVVRAVARACAGVNTAKVSAQAVVRQDDRTYPAFGVVSTSSLRSASTCSTQVDNVLTTMCSGTISLLHTDNLCLLEWCIAN